MLVVNDFPRFQAINRIFLCGQISKKQSLKKKQKTEKDIKL
jgi:hypothetical protein